MKITTTKLEGVYIIEPTVIKDSRGCFFVEFIKDEFKDIICPSVGKNIFVQHNCSISNPNVLRGIHYQLAHPQGKLVSVVHGEIYDVAVDLTKSSSTFGEYIGVTLSASNKKQLWVPPYYGHGFLVTSKNNAVVQYKVTEYYYPEDERCILWYDPTINVKWPIVGAEPSTSEKDNNGSTLLSAPVY